MLKFAVSPCRYTDIGEQRRTQGTTLRELLFFVTSGLVPDALPRKVHAAWINNKPICL